MVRGVIVSKSPLESEGWGMKQIKFLTFAALIIGLFAVMPRAVHAQELRQEITSISGNFCGRRWRTTAM